MTQLRPSTWGNLYLQAPGTPQEAQASVPVTQN
jgi:hypothetical protein